MGVDEFGLEFGRKQPQTDFEIEIASGDMRRALVAMRDLLAHELSGNRCTKCKMSQLRSGDLASLSLRLKQVLEELKNLPEGEEVSEIDRIKARRGEGVPETPHLSLAGSADDAGA